FGRPHRYQGREGVGAVRRHLASGGRGTGGGGDSARGYRARVPSRGGTPPHRLRRRIEQQPPLTGIRPSPRRRHPALELDLPGGVADERLHASRPLAPDRVVLRADRADLVAPLAAADLAPALLVRPLPTRRALALGKPGAERLQSEEPVL